MAGFTRYVTKHHYNDFPAQERGYAYETEQHVNNWYVVETKVERVRVPASRYTTFGGAPLKNDLQRENMLRYATKGPYEGYEQVYESDFENSSPPRHHKEGSLEDNFLNKLQVGERPPMKTSNLSSPNKNPMSPNKYRIESPKSYQPTDPNKYQVSNPKKYQPSSPNKYRPSSPNKHRATSPNKYRSSSPNMYHPSSPYKYRRDSPDKYGVSSPNKYRSTSPNRYHTKSPNKYRPGSPNKYHPSSPDRYQPKSPSKYRPTSSTYGYPLEEGHTIKAQTLPGPAKYRPTSPTKYRPTSTTQNYPTKEDNMKKAHNVPILNKYEPTNQVGSFPSKEVQPIRTQSLSGPNKNHYKWQSAGPPTTRHPLTGPTNNINEALGFLLESVNYSPQSDPKREGAFNNLSPRAQPIEHERRYARPAFGGETNRPYLRSNTIDSEEAVSRYNGAYVP